MTPNLGVQNNTNLLSYSPGGQKFKTTVTGLMSRGQQDWFLLEALWWEPVSFPLTVSRGHLCSLRCGLFPHTTPLSCYHCHSSNYWLWSSSLSYKDTCKYKGYSPCLKLLNLIRSTLFLLPCKVTYPQVPGIRTLTSFRAIIQSTTDSNGEEVDGGHGHS